MSLKQNPSNSNGMSMIAYKDSLNMYVKCLFIIRLFFVHRSHVHTYYHLLFCNFRCHSIVVAFSKSVRKTKVPEITTLILFALFFIMIIFCRFWSYSKFSRSKKWSFWRIFIALLGSVNYCEIRMYLSSSCSSPWII